MSSEERLSLKKILLIGISLGIFSGFGAVLFFSGVKYLSQFVLNNLLGYVYPVEGNTAAEISAWSPPDFIWLIIPIITAGALVSSIIVQRFAPEAEGHGTDSALKSYHTDGKIRWRVPFVKAISSIITIGTGGSAGCEGPAVQISAGFGSVISDIFHLSPFERKMAIAVGIGAGVGAIFKAPLGGALLAAEILYLRDFEYKTIIPAFIASIISYAIFGFFEGYTPLFGSAELYWSVPQIPLFIILGAAAALIGLLYIKTFYGSKNLFDKIFTKYRIPKFLKPVAGALIVGIFVVAMAYISPETLITAVGSLGTGYGFVQLALYNMLPLAVLILIPFSKILTTSLTIGSGASGGVFAPGLSIGAFTGGAFGMILYTFFPQIVPLESVPVFVIVGMIALFGGISHAPAAVMIMVLEMTTNFSILVPAMAAVILSVIILKDKTIFRQQRISKENQKTLDEDCALSTDL
ncbi:MAG: chloride channel protein [Methanocorpusculum sp.]|nr:chloride channel protein [Methanocorpusculum sp.]